MALYLLCWEVPLEGGQHPRHYLGWTDRPPEERLQDHLNGRNRPARIVEAALAAGRTVEIVRVWPDGDRHEEKRMKKEKMGFSHLCPRCNPSGLSAGKLRRSK